MKIDERCLRVGPEDLKVVDVGMCVAEQWAYIEAGHSN
jgi:hypothetical protein